MRSWRENPDRPESIEATKQHEREVFALQMMAKHDRENNDTAEDEDETDVDEVVVPSAAQKVSQ